MDRKGNTTGLVEVATAKLIKAIETATEDSAWVNVYDEEIKQAVDAVVEAVQLERQIATMFAKLQA